MQLENKVAIVTGAGSGMGAAISKMYAKEGAKVVAADMNQEGVNKTVEEITAAGGTAIAVVCNVLKEEDIENMFQVALETYSQIDILVNNAGILDNFVPAGDVTNDLWDKVLGVNLKAPMQTTRLALNNWLDNDRAGVIINIASVGGLFGARGGVSYVTSKHGIIGLTKNTAAVYAEKNIRCVAIAPGGIETNIAASMTEPNPMGAAALFQGVGPSPMGKPDDIASAATFLASEGAKFINGAVLTVDGGWIAK